MIDVNLLIKPPPAVRWWVVARTAAFIGALAMAGVTILTGVLEVQRLDAAIAEQQAIAATYETVSRRLPAVQAHLRSAEEALAELSRIARNQRFSQAAVLELVHPQAGNAWLTDVLFADGEVLVSGRSRAFDEAMAYLAQLRGQPQFGDVVEVELTTDFSGETAFTYLVRLREEGTGP